MSHISPTLSPYQRLDFLKQAGWTGATEKSVGEDWSQRKIFRVEKDGRSAILMHAVPDDDPRSTPGHKLRDFLSISAYLRKMGLSAPDVYAHDLNHGLLLVEDFGSDDFLRVITTAKERESDLYLLATDTLIHLYQKTEFIEMDLPDYYTGHIHKGRQRVVDWYMPATLHRKNEDGLVEDYLNVWSEIERTLPKVKRRMLHGDYHPLNLMWLPERVGIKQAGLIDFQGAMMGPAPYDLVNLLDDARRIVPKSIREECLARFVLKLPAEDRDSFLKWYPVLAAQFHCRVIGQAIRLAIRDGKDRLLAVVPTLQHHLVRDLSSPTLAPLKKWFDQHGVNFSAAPPLDIQQAAAFIREDAF